MDRDATVAVLYTVGHSTRSLDELAQLLERAGAQRLRHVRGGAVVALPQAPAGRCAHRARLAGPASRAGRRAGRTRAHAVRGARRGSRADVSAVAGRAAAGRMIAARA